MNNFLKVPKTKKLLRILCSILAILLAYGLGVTVGYRRAIFSSQFGENYYQNMYGDPFGQPMVGVMAKGPLTVHGVAGEVIDLSSSTLTVKDSMGNEQLIVVASGTTIREMDNDIVVDNIKIGDGVAVIGEPNISGQIEARFIRVFEGSSSLPVAGK